MKSLKKELFYFSCLLFCCLWASLSNAQTDNLPDLSKVKKGRLYTTGGTQIKFSKISINGSTLRFKNREKAFFMEMELNKVVRIEKQTGTRALFGGILGGGGALLCCLAGIAEVGSDPFVEVDETKARNLTIGLTLAGALIGTAIGSGIKKYKTIYEDSRFDLGSIRLKANWHYQTGSALVGLSYTF